MIHGVQSQWRSKEATLVVRSLSIEGYIINPVILYMTPNGVFVSLMLIYLQCWTVTHY